MSRETPSIPNHLEPQESGRQLRTVGIAIVIALLLALVAGCAQLGGGPTADPTAQTTPDSVQNSAPPADAPRTPRPSAPAPPNEDAGQRKQAEPAGRSTSNPKPRKSSEPKVPVLDQRCLTGRAICIDKSTRQLVWVIDGVPQTQFDVRFGAEQTPTREGAFTVEWKAEQWTSTIYHSEMPFSMFFSGGQAVHYSSDFAASGYNGASHGCVNVRDYDGLKTLFHQVNVGDKVIVYWS